MNNFDDNNIKEIKDKLKTIIISLYDEEIHKDDFKDENDNIRRLGLNSLKLMMLIAKIEIQFDIETDFEETSKDVLASVENLATYILKKLKNK